jgi:hypothetical protein
MSDTRLILHIKGTENQTAEIPRYIVRAGIAQGQISQSQLIWSNADNAWKQVRELPGLLPSQKILPAPSVRGGTVPLPKNTGSGNAQAGAVPKIAAKASLKSTPLKVKAMTVKVPVQDTSKDDLLVEQEIGIPFMKWTCIALAILILAAVGVNYLLVDRPIGSGLSQTIYSQVPVYAHLGAFLQPDALVIHVPVSPMLTSANLTDFLQVLAHGTPPAPTGKNPFDNVSLTTGWTGHYSFAGYAWQEFGDMAGLDEAHKRAFLLDNLRDSSGRPLVSPSGALDPAAQQAERDKAWTEFAAYFTR